ncbi:MAG TPA: hypothetical protein VHN78_04305 [Chloroflexota bacterium]|nr:hypothetical protein [Chloroflexota bacterium]
MNGAIKEPGQTKTGAPRGGPPLHCAAAAWCERHGLADDALRHALAAGDAAWAARLVERHIAAELFRGEGATDAGDDAACRDAGRMGSAVPWRT